MSYRDTLALREKYGRFEEIPLDAAPQAEHIDYCQACGSRKPHKLLAVKAVGAGVLVVGSDCCATLCSKKLASDAQLRYSGETVLDGEREYIYPSQEWADALKAKAYKAIPGRYGQQWIILNQFASSIWSQVYEHSKITRKQYDAASKLIQGAAQ